MKTRYFLVQDFGTKLKAKSRADVYFELGYTSHQAMVDDNGGVEPDIIEISAKDYLLVDIYDVL